MRSVLRVLNYCLLLLMLSAGNRLAAQPVFLRPEQGWNMNTLSPKDTNTIITLLHQAKLLRFKEPDSAMAILSHTLPASSLLGYDRGMIRSHIYTGDCLVEKKAYKQAQLQYQKAMVYCGSSTGYMSYRAFIHTQMGNAFQFGGEMQEAIYHYGKAAVIAGKVKDTLISLSRIYNNLAFVMSNIGQDKKAVYYLDQAEKIALDEHNTKQLGDIYINKGVAYAQQRNLEKAGYYFQAARTHAINENNHSLRQLATANLGKMLIDKGTPGQAIVYLKEALQLEKQYTPELSTIQGYLGMAYYRAKDYASAEPYLKQALHYYKNTKEAGRVLAMEGVMGEFYGAVGQHKRANEHLLRYIELYDSVKNHERLKQADKLEAQYRTALKDKELTQQQMQIDKQKNQIKSKNLWIIGTSAGILLLAVSITLLYVLFRSSKLKQRQEQQIREQYITSLQKDKEIGRLKALMEGEEKERVRLARELHDGIGGMLASTRMSLGAMKEGQSKEGQSAQLDIVMRMLTETAIEVRKTAHNLMPDVLIRYDLKKALSIYCEGINTSNLLQIDLEYYGELGQLNKAMELIVYRMVQELIQNIIKHAHASSATITVMLHESKLSISAEDNGEGFLVDEPNKGFGLQNLRHRVEALHGTIDIQSGKGGPTIIFIAFDFMKFKGMIL